MLMHLSTKGQVTIPQDIRERLGIGPGSAVDFELIEGAVIVRPCPQAESPAKPSPWIGRLRGSATISMTTDEIMAMTRGED